ncbi:uncharacterized protein METZ01_LOCUS479258, partial [marine metagenome]
MPPLLISRAWVGEVQAKLPEMPGTRYERFQDEYGLSEYDTSLLMTAKSIADFFEDALKARNLDGDALSKRAKALANLVNSELTRLMNQSGVDITESKV